MASTTGTGGLFKWFDRRTGLDGLLSETLDEPIPGGARFAYVFGSALLFIFISQVITGVFLALYYVPWLIMRTPPSLILRRPSRPGRSCGAFMPTVQAQW